MAASIERLRQNSLPAFDSALPAGFLPYEKFHREFALGDASTETINPITSTLSQTMHRDLDEGLRLLLAVDHTVLEGYEQFIPSIEKLAPDIAQKLAAGGKIFLVGSGSSGRVAVDIAAKCNQAFPQHASLIHGVIAGGDSAMVRAKEGFEDSIQNGEEALKDVHLGSSDTVFLISASGSASFNVGCGHYSAEKGAKVYYFYNSTFIPSRTQELFDRTHNPVIPLQLDTGPQAITGSTRLQAASLAEACLGGLLASASYCALGNDERAHNFPIELVEKLQIGMALVEQQLKSIGWFAEKQKEIFSDPRSNFRELGDHSNQGYVTLLASEDSIREVLIDATETSPTFSTNPIRREHELSRKRAEFRAYLVGEETNLKAWRALLGREIHFEDLTDVQSFILSTQEDGINAYERRPTGRGNFLMGVAKIDETQSISETLLSHLKNADGETGLLLICRSQLTELQKEPLKGFTGNCIFIENVPHDPLGIAETIVTKQTLNLISNASMVLMNKVLGNRMIDVRASNRKLIDRSMRLIKEIWNGDYSLTDEQLYHLVAHVGTLKEDYEERGIYTPSVVKIILAMLALNKTHEQFQEVLDYLRENQEKIE
ncbi:MAG: SIS domain-containing protein [Chlamydiota bacterium]